MEPSWKGLGDGFRSFLGDFRWILPNWGFDKESNFESKLKTEKVVPKSRGELESESTGGYGGPNIGK